ncbi:phosphatase PAP2 family protein [Sphaerochaeta sp. PS]|uniref:phosphatase PAP2 family protein n=1 Tax=Sphaerochaeta sp. PS TaxID=3076336 RepID=UPI0028A54371|nr:phosphatase PAP2 family protein [Sphaerochaeta sp. PS]MDT4761946.1 phosphatase PAP2 family protein [Sphaerochaeta sp. PS]
MQESILIFFQNIGTPFLDSFANFASAVGEQTFVIAVILYILWNHDKNKGFSICSSMLFSVMSMGLLKAIVRAPRPFQVLSSIQGKRLATATGYSFPSGHTTTAASFYSAVARAFKRRPLSIFCAFMIALVGISRLYLGVHWPIDVFGGLVLGVAITMLAYNRLSALYEDKDKRYRFSLVVGVITFVLGLGMAILLNMNSVDQVAFSDLMKTLALSGGGYLGFALEVKKVNYSTEATMPKKIVRFAIGMVVVVAVMALKTIIPEAAYYIGSFVRYAFLGFWATGLFPLIGKRVLFADAQ